MEGVLAGRKAVAISFPFFSGFNTWSNEEVVDAVQVHSCAVSKFGKFYLLHEHGFNA